LKTLIVDRVKLFQEIIAGVLSDSGIEHQFASTGKAALSMLDKEEYQCICVSLYLDDFNGIELCKMIRLNKTYRYTPIVLLTTESHPSIIAEAIKSGITDIFSKDNIHQLVNFIDRFTQYNKPLDGRVLYVEDQRSLREFVTNIFQQRALQVDAFDNADDAWEAFLKNHYHLVVSDLVLEGETSGVLLINKIRRLDGAKGDTPILAMTGFDESSRRISLYHMGITDYVAKPIIEEELIIRVKNLITNQKALEQEMEYREVMSSQDSMRRAMKMEALGKMTGGIAHDYNNVLGIISGFAELLSYELQDQPELLSNVQQIQSASRNAAALTNKLLAFTRRDRAGDSILNLNSIISDILPMLQKTLTASIQLQTTLDATLWTVAADHYELENAIINMCINAKHAMESNGTLTLATHNLDLNLEASEKVGLPPGQYVRLTVRDTGIGMDEDTLKHVFDPFFSTKGESGTGLGLTQVYGFVQRSNGAISAKSKRGKGTIIDLYFPRCDALAEGAGKDSNEEQIHDGHGRSVLVVDDESALRMLTQQILIQGGYKAEAVSNAEEALALLEKKPFDVMVSDIIMPGMNGFDLADAARQKYPKMQIILASGYDREVKNVEKRRESYQYRLQKPVSKAKLLSTIQTALK